MDAEAYFVTSSAPRAFTLMTRSNTAMSVSMGVAISPAVAAAVDHPVDVEALQRAADARPRR